MLRGEHDAAPGVAAALAQTVVALGAVWGFRRRSGVTTPEPEDDEDALGCLPGSVVFLLAVAVFAAAHLVFSLLTSLGPYEKTRSPADPRSPDAWG